MRGALPVAKKKAKKTVRSVAFRVTDDFGKWMESYAVFKRTTVSGLIDQALAEMAERDKFKKPPRRA